MKKNAAQRLADCAMKIAQKAAGQVSVCGTYQPKEPKALKK